MTVAEMVDRHRLVVCVGTGGVGKTTVAAAMALGAALRGRRAMVLTIDPARQLARALGLPSLAAGGERVAQDVLARAGEVAPGGAMHAAMLDQKGAWDAFIERHAPGEAIRRRILDNAFYQQLSSSFAGSAEYVAIEELCRLNDSGQHDLIVLDTPPTGGALDFLRAPERIDRLLLDPETVKWLSRPAAELASGARRRAGRAVALLVRRLERATGSRTLADVTALFAALRSLLGDIEARTRQARDLLRAPQTAFVLVTGPEERVLAQTEALRTEIVELRVPIRAVLLNRAHPLPTCDAREEQVRRVLEPLDAEGVTRDAIGWLERVHRQAVRVARAEHEQWMRFSSALPVSMERAVLPELERDLHSMEDLAVMVAALDSEVSARKPPVA